MLHITVALSICKSILQTGTTQHITQDKICYMFRLNFYKI